MESRERVAATTIHTGPSPDDDPDVRKRVASNAAVLNQTSDDYFSDWHRLRMAVAAFLRVNETLRGRRNDRLNVKDEITSNDRSLGSQEIHVHVTTKVAKPKDGGALHSPLTVQDLVKAELAILKFVQSSTFGKEIHALKESEKNPDGNKLRGQKKGGIKNESPIRRLDPFLDQEVGGRLRPADLPQETKHPAILPQKGHVATLLIRYAHKPLGHAGRSHVIASLREKYWIIKVNAALRHVISRCVFFCRNYSKPGEQKMADLPRNRISPAPPFAYTGVDYFGPFRIKEGRKEVKRYNSLFSCLVSRAVHIEVANSLESSSFIQALRRFIARRGARKELLQTIGEIEHEDIQAKLQKENLDWIFNPPATWAASGSGTLRPQGRFLLA